MDTYRILIVDDDEVDRMRVRRAMERAEFRCEISEAQTAGEGRQMLARGPYDCVFVDYRLPDGDGLEFVRAARREGLTTSPIVVMTGEGNEKLAVDFMKAGATDYISKGEMVSERLLQCVRAAMRLRRADSKPKSEGP